MLDAEKVLKRDEKGKPVTRRAADGGTIQVYDYRNPRRPEWPEAEFIVGNRLKPMGAPKAVAGMIFSVGRTLLRSWR